MQNYEILNELANDFKNYRNFAKIIIVVVPDESNFSHPAL
jgi:hypothetical protein